MNLRMQHVKWVFVIVGAFLAVFGIWFLYGHGGYSYLAARDACVAEGCFKRPGPRIVLKVDENLLGRTVEVPFFFYKYRIPEEGLRSAMVLHRKGEVLAVTVEHEGRTIIFWKPRPDYWFLELLNSARASDLETYEIILGGLTDDYQLLKKLYQVTPKDIGIFSSPAETMYVRNKLVFKRMVLNPAAGDGIAEIEIGKMRGFAYGEPFKNFLIFDLGARQEVELRSNNWGERAASIAASISSWTEDEAYVSSFIKETARVFSEARKDKGRLPLAMLYAASWLSFEPEDFRPWEMLLNLYVEAREVKKGLSLLNGLEDVFPSKRRVLSKLEERLVEIANTGEGF